MMELFTNRAVWEDHYFDLWTIPHTLFGFVMAFGFAHFGLPASYSLIATIFIAILWESIEYLSYIPEFVTNQIVDVAIALVGFGIATLLIMYVFKTPEDIKKWFYIFVIALTITSVIGWFAWFQYGRP